MKFDVTTLQRIVGSRSNRSNMNSLIAGLDSYGSQTGLNAPHRLYLYLGQIIHESAGLRYDKEIWGPTRAQARYDTRTDLGNTAAADGDGYKYRGRGPIQITGKSNYAQYTMWARQNLGNSSPNFVMNPDAVNTDPWEGLVPIWYWSTRNLNAHADRGDIRRITRIINGGYNGFADRQRQTDRSAMVLMGYGTKRGDVKRFQASERITADGIIGSQTRKYMHNRLMQLPEIYY